jgi:hypothetical protein
MRPISVPLLITKAPILPVKEQSLKLPLLGPLAYLPRLQSWQFKEQSLKILLLGPLASLFFQPRLKSWQLKEQSLKLPLWGPLASLFFQSRLKSWQLKEQSLKLPLWDSLASLFLQPRFQSLQLKEQSLKLPLWGPLASLSYNQGSHLARKGTVSQTPTIRPTSVPLLPTKTPILTVKGTVSQVKSHALRPFRGSLHPANIKYWPFKVQSLKLPLLGPLGGLISTTPSKNRQIYVIINNFVNFFLFSKPNISPLVCQVPASLFSPSHSKFS